MQKHRLFIILGFSMLMGCAHTAPVKNTLFDDEFPSAKSRCEDTPWCETKAVLKDWPKAPEIAASVLVSNWTFMFRLPTGFEKLTVVSGDKLPMLAAHYSGYNIAVALDEFSSFLSPTGNARLNAEIARAHASSKFLPNDAHRILFTASPEEAEPENLYDRMLWRFAFLLKSSKLYEPESPPEMYQNGKWTVYSWARSETPPRARHMIITHQDFPARYLNVITRPITREAPQAVLDYLITTLTLDH